MILATKTGAIDRIGLGQQVSRGHLSATRAWAASPFSNPGSPVSSSDFKVQFYRLWFNSAIGVPPSCLKFRLCGGTVEHLIFKVQFYRLWFNSSIGPPRLSGILILGALGRTASESSFKVQFYRLWFNSAIGVPPFYNIKSCNS